MKQKHQLQRKFHLSKKQFVWHIFEETDMTSINNFIVETKSSNGNDEKKQLFWREEFLKIWPLPLAFGFSGETTIRHADSAVRATKY